MQAADLLRSRLLAEYDLGSEAPDAALDSLTQLAASICGTPVGLVTLVDEARQVFRARSGYDGAPAAPLDVGFCPIVVERGEPVVIPDTEADPAHAGNEATLGGVRFYAGMPLRTEDRSVLGTLCVLDRSPRLDGLTPTQLDALRTLAAQVVSQFELRRALARRDALLAEQAAVLREREALARVQAAIVAADGDLDTILASLVRHALDALPVADGGVLELIEGDTLQYRAVAGTLVPHAGLVVPLAGSLAGRCVETNTPFLIDDARTDDRVLRALVEPLGVRSAILAPVARGDRVLGVLKLQSGWPGAFRPRDLDALALFAGAATTGLTEVRAAAAQATMLSAARRHQAILDSATDFAIVATDEAGLVTEWNVGAGRILGWTAAEMHGASLARIFTPEDRAAGRFETEMLQARSEGRASDERWHLRRDGSRFWASGEVMPLRNGSGTPEGYLKILRDRTEERQRQRARDAAARRRAALLQVGDGLRNLEDLAAMSATVSEIVARALDASWAGFGRVDVASETLVIDRDWAEDPSYCLAGSHPLRNYGSYIDDLLQNRVVAIGDVRDDPRTKGRGEAFAALGVDALINAPVVEFGRLEAIFCIASTRVRHWDADEIEFVQDVAERTRVAIERRRAETSLRDLNARLESEVGLRTAERDRMWNSSPDLMVVLSAEGHYRRVNPAWRTVLGYTPAELVGAYALDLAHPEDLPATRAALDTSQTASLPVFENRFRHRDGSFRWIQWVAAPGPGGIFATGRDITQAKTAQARLAEAEGQLRQSQKMEAVGQLTGGLAHDFNNLLTGITGALELLATRVAQGRHGELDRYLDAAQGAARRAAALTHRLLAFSRQQTLDPRSTDANRLVAGMEELIRRTVGPGIEVAVEPADGLWPTLVDPNQLENAVLNLCINARDAMPEGGRLVIDTANVDLTGRSSRDRDLKPGQYVAIGVSDTGIGMSADVIAKAFDPFFTTKPLGQGTGLGLSMIYGFARQSGGQVRIHSQEGLGTRMRVYLPRHAGGTQDTDADPAPVDKRGTRATHGETVLVVDDEPTIRMLVVEVLEDLGYAAIEAADGASGLAILRSPERVDLLVSDVGLPGGLNGRQMAEIARVARPDLKVLFITGYAETTILGPAHLESGMHVMTKPFAMEALANRIKEIISGQNDRREVS